MDPDFQTHIDSLHPSLERLRDMRPILISELPKRRLSGIYLFSEYDQPMYVGRTRNLRGRFKGHCGEKSGENQAAFAFKLARIETDQVKATYTKSGSRRELLKDPVFAGAFARAKQRISRMDLRFVEETDPLRQMMLEIYATFVLKANHNDFDTH